MNPPAFLPALRIPELHLRGSRRRQDAAVPRPPQGPVQLGRYVLRVARHPRERDYLLLEAREGRPPVAQELYEDSAARYRPTNAPTKATRSELDKSQRGAARRQRARLEDTGLSEEVL